MAHSAMAPMEQKAMAKQTMSPKTIAVLGTGMVGRALATRLVERGHRVIMGSRTADNATGLGWALAAGDGASAGTFAEAAGAAEMVFLCVKGEVALAVCDAAGAALDGKVLVDVTNPLDFSKGMPPTLFVFGTDSLAEQIARAHPGARVVKSLNTINASVMVDPSRVPGATAVFMSSDDALAKQTLSAVLRDDFGWRQIIDLGGLSTARGTEAYLLLWLRLWQATGTGDINIALHVAPKS